MNRLGKILTLGLEKKRAWQLPVIAVVIVVFGLDFLGFSPSAAILCSAGIRPAILRETDSRATSFAYL